MAVTVHAEADDAGQAGTVHVRRMRPKDIGAVFEIERGSYAEPWPLAFFLLQLDRGEDSLFLVAEQEGVVIGYLVAERCIDVWHVMNLCVDAPWRRRHVATQLLAGYFAASHVWSHHGHALEVRVSNDGARALYRQQGFVAVGIRPHYYSDDGEDAVTMWRDWGKGRA